VMYQLIPELAWYFDVLDIDGQRSFSYETCYFDDENFSSYFDHHQGKRKRFKVRTRKYTDAGLCFMEVKFKSTRGMTIKKRLPYDINQHKVLDEHALAYIKAAYETLYGNPFNYSFSPTLEMQYHRITLVAKHGPERMTIDYDLSFLGDNGVRSIRDDRFIVEAKSLKGNGIADKLLRKYHQHPTKHCSKYCIGMSFMEQVTKNNRFLPALRKLS